jgi:hypothetical protein
MKVNTLPAFISVNNAHYCLRKEAKLGTESVQKPVRILL